MRIRDVHWNQWNIEHIARHGVDPAEAEEVVFSRIHHAIRVGSARYLITGQTAGGRYLAVVVERAEPGDFVVITARDATLRERRIYDRSRGR